MENLTKQIYADLYSKIEWNQITHSVNCEIYTAQLNKFIGEYRAILGQDEVEFMPPHYRMKIEATIEAYIALVVELTMLAMALFISEGFTAEEQADYYPKEMGDWGEGA
jgi:hypothetical protein